MEWELPNDSPSECCIKELNKIEFISGGAYFQCPHCNKRINMLEANRYTIQGVVV